MSNHYLRAYYSFHFRFWWLSPLKDLLQAVIWVLAFAGNRIEWRGERMRLRRDGTLQKDAKSTDIRAPLRSHT